MTFWICHTSLVENGLRIFNKVVVTMPLCPSLFRYWSAQRVVQPLATGEEGDRQRSWPFVAERLWPHHLPVHVQRGHEWHTHQVLWLLLMHQVIVSHTESVIKCLDCCLMYWFNVDIAICVFVSGCHASSTKRRPGNCYLNMLKLQRRWLTPGRSTIDQSVWCCWGPQLLDRL